MIRKRRAAIHLVMITLLLAVSVCSATVWVLSLSLDVTWRVGPYWVCKSTVGPIFIFHKSYIYKGRYITASSGGSLLGIGYDRRSFNDGARATAVLLRPWVPVAALAAYLTCIVVPPWTRRHRRRERNQCVWCGYSLVGNLSGICPECGERV